MYKEIYSFYVNIKTTNLELVLIFFIKLFLYKYRSIVGNMVCYDACTYTYNELSYMVFFCKHI